MSGINDTTSFALTPEEKEMLQDLLIAATNKALENIEPRVKAEMQKSTCHLAIMMSQVTKEEAVQILDKTNDCWESSVIHWQRQMYWEGKEMKCLWMSCCHGWVV